MSELTETTARPNQARATGIGLVAIMLWAALALLTVHANGIPSFELLSLTFGVAFLAGLAALAMGGRERLAELRQPAAPWLTAFVGIFLYHALYFFALSAAPAAQASLIAYLWPLLIVLLSTLAAGQRLRPAHLIGAILGLAGTFSLFLGKNTDAISTGATMGYLAAFGCAFVWSGYSVANRKYGATPSGMLVGVCGAIAVAGAICHLIFEATVAPNGGQWFAIIALGLGPTGLAFFAWDHATKHGNLPLLGALSYLAPLVSTLLLIVTGQAESSLAIIVAALLIIGGAAIAAKAA